MAIVKFDSSAFVAEPALVEALCRRAVPVDCTRDLELFRQGEAVSGLYILHSGEVAMSIEDTKGKNVVSMRAQPGSLLGLPGLVSNQTYSMTASAKAGSQVSVVSREEFATLMLTEPMLSMMILRVLAAEVRTARLAMVDR